MSEFATAGILKSVQPARASMRTWSAAPLRVLLAASGLAVASGGGVAAEEWVWSLPCDLTLAFYGQVSPTTLTVDDGVARYSSVRDNAHATTRLGFHLTRKLGERTVRWTFESGFGVPTTSGTSQTTANYRWAFGDATVRKAEVQITGPLGVWSLGQGATATDGVATRDLSRTTVVGSSAIRDDAGSFEFRSSKTGDLTGIRLGDVFANFDGNRLVRVRYDAPRWRGFSVAAAAAAGLDDFYEGAETFADAALSYQHDTAALRVDSAAGLSWQWEGDGDQEDTVSMLGSISALHPESGISMTAATGLQVDGGRYVYFKAGYRASPFSFGDTFSAVDLYLGQDFETQGSQSRSLGFQLVQSWERRRLEVYLGIRRYSYQDTTPETYRDAYSVLAGLRWQF